MTKRPILSAFLTAVMLSILLAVVLPYSTQESPWALSFIVFLIFPLIWFFAWLVFNALAWWQDTMAPEKRPANADEPRAPPR